jgi:hypothetical protein
MTIAPIITYQTATNPSVPLGTIAYVQSSPGGDYLPVLQGETSNAVLFRIYNNFALTAGVASALNISLTIFDGVGVASHTCAMSAVAQSWIRMRMNGYGENSTTSPDRFTQYIGTDTAIGGTSPCGSNSYAPEKGSDGVAAVISNKAKIRAYNNTNGMGYIEFSTTALIPQTASSGANTFAISMSYEYAL